MYYNKILKSQSNMELDIPKIAARLSNDPGALKNWRKIYDELSLPASTLPNYKSLTITNFELFSDILEKWKLFNGERANVQNLENILNSLGFMEKQNSSLSSEQIQANKANILEYIKQKWMRLYTWANKPTKVPSDNSTEQLNNFELQSQDKIEFVQKLAELNGENKNEIFDFVIHEAFKRAEWLQLVFHRFPELIKEKTRAKQSFLHYAVRGNKIKAVEFFIEKGLDINEKDRNGQTPLHWAASKWFLGIIAALLNRGADPNVVDNWENTPLHYVAWGNQVAIAQMLLVHNLDPNIENDEGNTAMDIAKNCGHAEMMQLLKNY